MACPERWLEREPWPGRRQRRGQEHIDRAAVRNAHSTDEEARFEMRPCSSPVVPFRKPVAPVAGSSGTLRRAGDGFSRQVISPCCLNENAPVGLCLRQQPPSQPPTHRQARSPMAKRKQRSQTQPASTVRQGGLLAKNSRAFCSPSPCRDTFLWRNNLR
jgi:hypothetical protein